jgi:hypothetical protein
MTDAETRVEMKDLSFSIMETLLHLDPADRIYVLTGSLSLLYNLHLEQAEVKEDQKVKKLYYDLMDLALDAAERNLITQCTWEKGNKRNEI